MIDNMCYRYGSSSCNAQGGCTHVIMFIEYMDVIPSTPCFRMSCGNVLYSNALFAFEEGLDEVIEAAEHYDGAEAFARSLAYEEHIKKIGEDLLASVDEELLASIGD